MNRYVAKMIVWDEPYIEVTFDESESVVRIPVEKLKVVLSTRRYGLAEKLGHTKLPTKCPKCVAKGQDGNLEACFRNGFFADVVEVNGQIAFEYNREAEVSYDLHWLQSISCNECGVLVQQGPAETLG